MDATKPFTVTKRHFLDEAMRLDCTIEDRPVQIAPKLFTTGSLGWQHMGKAVVKLADGTEIDVQVNLLITAIGSKNWPTT